MEFPGHGTFVTDGDIHGEVWSESQRTSIDPASSGHRGNYTCTVRNRAGSVNYTASLDVHGMLNVVVKACIS